MLLELTWTKTFQHYTNIASAAFCKKKNQTPQYVINVTFKAVFSIIENYYPVSKFW